MRVPLSWLRVFVPDLTATGDEVAERLIRAGFEVEQVRYLNPTGPIGWFLNGRVLRRTTVPLGQAKWYDRVYPLLSLLERLNLPFGFSEGLLDTWSTSLIESRIFPLSIDVHSNREHSITR